MRNLLTLTQYRLFSPTIKRRYGSYGDDKAGAFVVPSRVDKAELTIIASACSGWDHVSVSRKNRCPNWPEMDQIKRLFFYQNEVVVQFHVAEKDHINIHSNTLHLWRSWTQTYDLPPHEFV